MAERPRLSDRRKRGAILRATAWLPRPLRVAARYRLLANLALGKARRADVLLIKHPKSGSTWLRVMLFRLYQVRYGLPPRRVVKSDEMHLYDSRLPRLQVTNGHYSYEGELRTLFRDPAYAPLLARKRILFLARNPLDLAPSWFFQLTRRATAYKSELMIAALDQPIRRDEISMWDFVTHPELGVPNLIDYHNWWVETLAALPNALVVRYEDLRVHTADTLKQITSFIGEEFKDDEIADAVEFAAFENLKRLEHSNYFENSGLRLRSDDPRTHKVRRGVVGGYREYFDEDQLHELREMVRTRLEPALGYETGAASDAGS